MRNIISVGECMVELARRPDGAFDLRVGGDTFNTAIYMARLGAPVRYMTAIGDDPYSAQILNRAGAESIVTDTICVVHGRMPGLYLIETKDGERNFWYWRDRSPARELFELPDADKLIEVLANASMIYLSGITLSLYSDRGLDRLEGALIRVRQGGGQVALDGNFRPAGWGHDLERARSIYARFWQHADIALPSFDDEQVLWGDTVPAQTFERLAQFGVTEFCLRLAGQGAMVQTGCTYELVPPTSDITPIDTTAAGDSFSAAYLWARLNGHPPAVAAEHGNRLAQIVIQHPGAIAPKSATDAFSL